jgi:hypothetical protein
MLSEFDNKQVRSIQLTANLKTEPESAFGTKLLNAAKWLEKMEF